MKRLLFISLSVLWWSPSLAQLPPGPLPESSESNIGYGTVAEALASLQSRNDVSVSTNRGWTIVIDEKHYTVWSFAPKTYAAYPAVVKRSVKPRPGGGSDINTSVLCEASKEACDQLVREFDALNGRLPGVRNSSISQ
jgi:hypothetical protein